MTAILRLPRLHPGQLAMAAGLKRFNVARMGRRWGKTIFGFEYLLDCPTAGNNNALNGYPVAWFAPTYKYLKEPWRDAKRILKPLIVHKDEVDHRLELRTGGVIEFWTLDSDDPARGRKYARVVVDEAAMVRRLMTKWDESIRPTLTDYRGGALFASTPKGKNDFWRLDQRSERKPATWASFHAPSSQNPHLDPAEIEEARNDMPSLAFLQEYEAEYVQAGGGVLKPEWIQTGRPPIDFPIVLGVDLAISTKTTADYTAIVAMCRDHGSGIIYIIGAWRFRAKFNDIIMRIESKNIELKPVCVGVESNVFQSAVVTELARRSLIPVRGMNRTIDKLAAFSPMALRFEQGLVRIHPEIEEDYVDELLAFTGTKDDEHDDFVDATSNAYLALANTGPSIASAGTREMHE